MILFLKKIGYMEMGNHTYETINPHVLNEWLKAG